MTVKHQTGHKSGTPVNRCHRWRCSTHSWWRLMKSYLQLVAVNVHTWQTLFFYYLQHVHIARNADRCNSTGCLSVRSRILCRPVDKT